MKKKISAKRTKRTSSPYHRYVVRYNREKRRLNQRGFEMADRKLSKAEYDATVEGFKNDLGETPRDINRAIIEKQKFDISAKVARQVLNNWSKIKEMDDRFKDAKRPTSDEIRSGQTQFFDYLSDYYKSLRTSGYSSNEAKHAVSQSVFGSK